MKHFFFILFMTISSQSFAKDKTAYQYDNNKDGKVDSTYFYDKSGFIKFERDRNYDSKIDHSKLYNSTNSIYKEKKDTNFDGKFDYLKIAQRENDQFYVKEYTVVKGIKTLINQYQVPIVQVKDDNCNYIDRSNILNEISSFVEKFDKTLSKANDDFYSIENFQIHKSCKKQFGKKTISKVISNATKQGLSCLTKIAKEEKKSKKQIELFNLLNRMDSALKDNSWNVTVMCNNTKYFKKNEETKKSDALAAATAGPGIFQGVPHPVISISPHLKTGWGSNISKDELTSVFFHEMLHNYGYTHQDGIDTVYGCEVCCFPKNFKKESITAACNVCKGNYSGELDKKYIKDSAILGHYSSTITAKEFFSNNYKKLENSSHIRASFMTAIMNMHPEMLNKLNSKYPDVTKEFHKELNREMNSKKGHNSQNQLVDKQSKIAATLIGDIFFEKDKEQIIKTLNKLEVDELPYAPSRYSSMTNRQHPGGLKLLTDVEVLIKMALRSEEDPKLKELYSLKLWDIDRAFKNYSKSNKSNRSFNGF